MAAAAIEAKIIETLSAGELSGIDLRNAVAAAMSVSTLTVHAAIKALRDAGTIRGREVPSGRRVVKVDVLFSVA